MVTTLDPDLADRLERLTGADAACCAADLAELAGTIRDRDTYGTVLETAKALSDPNRLTALFLLAERGEMCACEIQAALGLTHATVSHHMKRLRAAGLVSAERRGSWTYYEATDDALACLEVGSS